jgi:hypothetical protein
VCEAHQSQFSKEAGYWVLQNIGGTFQGAILSFVPKNPKGKGKR